MATLLLLNIECVLECNTMMTTIISDVLLNVSSSTHVGGSAGTGVATRARASSL